ncbi:MAG: hypothetical protein KZQ70_10600 [gamma proteobacterium symbiont of Lucinoma myriamae]|nr:hypothetical protein [gamma proteobacterium symbiont of Lucinoma myriamae]MCU7819623.1 hypothetical protein [gamma proteobacterium symbiont of Lucinoma myriamae]
MARTHRVLTSLSFGILMFSFYVYSPPTLAAPHITWSQKSIYKSLEGEANSTVPVTFTTYKDIEEVYVSVVPEIAPFVSVSIESFNGFFAGEVYELELHFKVPENALIGTIEGVIQLRSGKNNLSKPLPIKLEVLSLGGINIESTNFWYALSSENTLTYSNVEYRSEMSNSSLQNESFFKIYRHVNVNPEKFNITDWFDEHFYQGGSAYIRNQMHMMIGGRDALQIEVSELGGIRVHTYIFDNVDVLEVSYGLFAPHFVVDYESMLQSIEFTEVSTGEMR